MSTPWAILSGRLAASAGEGARPAILSGLQASVTPPAIVIRPDEPWMEQGGASWTKRTEHWVAVLVASATSPDEATFTLYDLAKVVLDAASDEGWDWESVSAITLDESTGVPLLVATVRLTYKAPRGG